MKITIEIEVYNFDFWALADRFNYKLKIGYPIFLNLPPYPYPIISDFHKPTYLPKRRISFLDAPLLVLSRKEQSIIFGLL